MKQSDRKSQGDRRSSPSGRWQAWVEAVAGQDEVDLLGRLTLILLILHSGYLWYHQMVIVLLGIAGLIFRPLARSPVFWLILAGWFIGVRNGIDWVYSDNHDFLIGYWCLAFGCALLLPDPAAALATNGRWLIALTFLFATLTKLISPQYLKGDVFYFLLYEDKRFSELAYLLAGFRLEAADSLFSQLKLLDPEATMRHIPGLEWVALVFTWWTVFIEGAIAIAFIWPASGRVHLCRHGLLVAFLVTTYPPTNVLTFAWILITMGLASTPAEMRKTRFCYVVLFAALSCLGHSTFKQTTFEFFAAP